MRIRRKIRVDEKPSDGEEMWEIGSQRGENGYF